MVKTLRSLEVDKQYKDYLKRLDVTKFCPMCGKIPIKEFNHWKIVNNRFPYDLIAKVHHILIPKRHVIEKELTEEEFKEFVYIKESYVSKEGYHWILEATGKSFPGHFHVHLITRHDKLV